MRRVELQENAPATRGNRLFPSSSWMASQTKIARRLIMGILGRISDIISANLNDLTERFEEPEKMLKQAIL